MGYERDMDRIVRLGNEVRNQIIRELIERVPECLWGFSDSEQQTVADWLKSQMEVNDG